MSSITNDQEFRAALDALDESGRRFMAGCFVRSVLDLSRDTLVQRAVEVALNPERSDPEIEQAYRAAKGYAAKTFTACGNDTDWLAQADHFVAMAAAAALQPSETTAKGKNLAWQAALEARMAKNCLMIHSDQAGDHNEAQQQYLLLENYAAI